MHCQQITVLIGSWADAFGMKMKCSREGEICSALKETDYIILYLFMYTKMPDNV